MGLWGGDTHHKGHCPVCRVKIESRVRGTGFGPLGWGIIRVWIQQKVGRVEGNRGGFTYNHKGEQL